MATAAATTAVHSQRLFRHSLQPCSQIFGGRLCVKQQQHQKQRHGLCVHCATEKVGFFGRLGRVIKEKAKSDVELLFSGFSKTRENLAVIDELLTYWNLADSEQVLDELEEALLVADFGPKTAVKIVEKLRKEILEGKLKTGSDIKAALKSTIVALLTEKINTSELNLGTRPAVIMIIGVNGGGKTTTLGKLAHRFKKEDTKVLMAAGDTFRAAASEQLEVWAERTGSDIVRSDKEKPRPVPVLLEAVRKGVGEGYDIVLCDTSGPSEDAMVFDALKKPAGAWHQDFTSEAMMQTRSMKVAMAELLRPRRDSKQSVEESEGVESGDEDAME
ncbi:hypothetical protein L7F22_003719 [Adiantum nelumboides]|nr:hypothetical protein [Adiantum nelumboides]